jgi:predicted AlkP superfamily phosphohydrolase/phosphomutase
MSKLKCYKKHIFKKQLWKTMKLEKDLVEEYCLKRDWDNAGKWLHRSKSTFKAYRRVSKL